MSELVSISNEFLRLSVLPALGGSIASFDALIDGHWQPILRRWNKDNTPLATGCFPMLPFCNRIQDAQFAWQGGLVSLQANLPPESHAIHGFGWQQSWTLEHLSGSQILISHHQDDPGQWPFSYLCFQRFSLSRCSLRAEMVITNQGTELMPVGAGFHPYFCMTPDVRLIADCEEQWLVDDNMMPEGKIPVSPQLQTDQGMALQGSGLDNLFSGFKSPCRIIWPGAGVQLDMRTSNSCRFLQVYCPDAEDYFCVEPQSMSIDGFNRQQAGLTDSGTALLEPGESFTVWMELFPASVKAG
ncbi:aldose 1-epimerase [Shewanella sp. GXUN23E]|uniref:aldose 1-epimerase n=1 Tax=Shewanella sp. GXUN23E TaxID=3422498 RepID=UPI003D7CB1F8